MPSKLHADRPEGITTAVFDYDAIVYRAACAVESKQIKVLNKKTNEELIFKNRTELYGGWKKKDGGWLAEQEGLTLEDLEIEDFREVEPVENALGIAKNLIEGILEMTDLKQYRGYLGGRDNFRKFRCTLLPYKGNRVDAEPPYWKDAVVEYLMKYHNAEEAIGVESDDLVAQAVYKDKKNIGIVLEKDYYGADGRYFNFVNQEYFVVDGLGYLEKTPKGIKGVGRIWKYFQVCWQDAIDNYYANCFSDKQNGEVAVYNRLKGCKTDKEAFQAMKEHFLHLYPEPKVITNWKNETFEIDWIYVMQECFDMAHLLRYPGDRVNVREVYERYGISTAINLK